LIKKIPKDMEELKGQRLGLKESLKRKIVQKQKKK
jgi:hypothetical protein